MLALAAVLLAAQPNPYLGQAKVLHQGLEFEKCMKRLEQASRWENNQAQLAEIELYSGLCSFGLGQEREAAEHFEMAIKIDPKIALPPLVGPKVTRLYERARKKIEPLLKQAEPEPEAAAPPPEPPRQLEPPKPAVVEAPPPAPVVEEKKEKELHLAAPLVVGGLGVVAAGIGGYFGATAKGLETRAKDVTAFQSDTIAWGRQASTDALIANVCWGVAAAALAVAVVLFIVQN